MEKEQKNILWFKEVGIGDITLVGGKNASLGEMIQQLTPKGINIPDGFATTAKAYFDFLEKAGIKEKIKEILRDIDVSDIKNLQEKGRAVRALIARSHLPEDLEKEISDAYSLMSREYGEKQTDVAVRSSATAEDLPNASFAGQQETYLNIRGDKNVAEAVKKCFISLFTDRAIVYREEMKFDHLKLALSVGVQKMIRSDLSYSGVMFSCDTENGFGDVILINGSYGLGENIVKGMVDPDQYYVFETTLKSGFKPILEKRLGRKLVKLIYNKNQKATTKNISTPIKDRQRFVLTDEEILDLSRWSVLIEDYYGKSMDMEWAKDGKAGKLYIVQARPETVQSRKNLAVLENYVLDKNNKKIKLLAEGLSVGNKIGQGRARKIMNVKDIKDFKKGEVLVTDMTDPDWVPVMKIASAIITDRGGRTCHTAIVSRELGIPSVVGVGNATRVIKTSQEITVSCAEGETGKIYQGIIPFEIKKTDISNLKKPAVKIMMNVGEPDLAFGLSFVPNDGVGLAREEFIIANNIKIHPLALINYRKMPSIVKNKIDEIAFGYKSKTDFYIEKLAQGMGKIGAAFYPKEVIVRFSDFKTNEYRNLIGGEFFEPVEENPMLGFRGACRYLDEKFQPAFNLECEAIKRARNIFGLANINVMVPFCRTVEEGRKVVDLMEKNGLKKGGTPFSILPSDGHRRGGEAGGISLKERGGRGNGLKIYMMCEIPTNVVLIEEFLEIFDGVSIGSNDLTQLCLGLDRDNSRISHIGDERNPAIKRMIRKVIKVCNEKGKYCGICGQAPSDFPDFAEFLVKEGIKSISLNPDTAIKTILFLNGLDDIVVADKNRALLDPRG